MRQNYCLVKQCALVYQTWLIVPNKEDHESGMIKYLLKYLEV